MVIWKSLSKCPSTFLEGCVAAHATTNIWVTVGSKTGYFFFKHFTYDFPNGKRLETSDAVIKIELLLIYKHTKPKMRFSNVSTEEDIIYDAKFYHPPWQMSFCLYFSIRCSTPLNLNSLCLLQLFIIVIRRRHDFQ